MTQDEWKNWQADSLKYFKEHYANLHKDLALHGVLRKKSELTSILYLFNGCNSWAAAAIMEILEKDALEDDVLANYLLGHIFICIVTRDCKFSEI